MEDKQKHVITDEELDAMIQKAKYLMSQVDYDTAPKEIQKAVDTIKEFLRVVDGDDNA